MPLKFPGSPKQRVLCPKYRIDFDIFWCIKILREENSREENSQEENRREENRHKVGIYVQLLDQAGNTKMEVSTSSSFCFPLIVINQEN